MTSAQRSAAGSGSRGFARLYDAVMRAADRRGLTAWRRRVVAGLRGCVLEIGAGTGLEFEHYEPGAAVVAIEPDLGMISRAVERQRRSGASITLVVADARALPFADATFDTVVAVLAFCTIPQPEEAAGELRRVVRPSGHVRLLEHVRARHRIVAWTQVCLTPIWSRVAGGCHLARSTAETLRAAGFAVTVREAAYDGVLVGLEARPASLASSENAGADQAKPDTR